MKRKNRKPSVANVALGLLVVAIIVVTLHHTVSYTQQQNAQGVGLPMDWTHQVVIFSNPGTFQEANRDGNFLKWYRILNDPRFRMQQLRRSLAMRQGGTSSPVVLEATPEENPAETGPEEEIRDGVIGLLAPEMDPFKSKVGHGLGRQPTPPPVPARHPLHGDWTMLPAAGAVGIAGVYPAKYEFYPGTASCTDYVVFPTGIGGTSSKPSIVAYTNLYSSCASTSPNNPVPNVQWAVDLAGGTVNTSPVLSWDGTQVAFVATISGVANLVVMNLPALGTISTVPVSVIGSSTTNVNTTSYPSCTLCATYAALSGNPTDTYSSPFYDYTNNVLYVGDASSVLHKFTNVFYNYNSASSPNTTKPTEITGGGTTSGWPQTIKGVGNVAAPLSNPVYDSVSGNVFVGVDVDSSGIAYIPGGGSSTGGGSSNVVNSGKLNRGNKSTETYSLIVDSSADDVYVFTEHGNSDLAYDTANVYLLSTTFASGVSPTAATAAAALGTKFDDKDTMWVGAFDQTYYNSSHSSRAGNLYVCAPVESTTNGSQVVPTLFRVAISGGVLSTVSTGPELNNGTGDGLNCSPVTEIYNGTNDYIFMSQVSANVTGSPIGCPSGTGCIVAWDMASAPTLSNSLPSTSAQAGAASGTSGIIIDNTVSSGSPSGAQVYYMVLGSQSCSRTVTGGTTSASANITASAGIFTAGDVGASITATNDLQASTTISSVTDSTHAVISKTATGTNSSDTFTITDTGGCAIQASQSALK